MPWSAPVPIFMAQNHCWHQLADAISEVESNEETVRIDSADGDTQMPLQLDEALVKSHDKTLDWFELAILRLKPMNPEAERLCENVTEGGCLLSGSKRKFFHSRSDSAGPLAIDAQAILALSSTYAHAQL